MSATAKIRLMLIDNKIKTYDDFKCLNKEKICLLEQVKTGGATARLKSHHAQRVNDTREYISFIEKVVILHWLMTQLLGLSKISRDGSERASHHD